MNVKNLFRLIIFGVLCLLTLSIAAQPAMPVADGVGFFWRITESKIEKLNNQGVITAVFSNLSLGIPNEVDPTDPFRVLVFYHESQSLVVLNSNATILGNPINLIDLDLGEIASICRSKRGGFWALCSESGEIIHFNDQMKTTGARIIIDNPTVLKNPTFILERSGILYAGLNGDGVARFDSYGARLESIWFNYSSIRIEDAYIWYSLEGVVYRYFVRENQTQKFEQGTPCTSLPFSVNQDIMCFDGEKFNLLIKNE